MDAAQIRAGILREEHAVVSLLSNFDRARRSAVGQHIDILAEARPEDLPSVVSHAQDAIALNFTMQSPALGSEERDCVQSCVLLSQRLRDAQARRAEMDDQLLVSSVLAIVDALASGSVSEAVQIQEKFAVPEKCRAALAEKIAESDSLYYPLVHSSPEDQPDARPAKAVRVLSGQTRGGAPRAGKTFLDHIISSSAVLLIITYLTRMRPLAARAAGRRFLQRFTQEVHMNPTAVGNYLLLDTPKYKTLILLLDSFYEMDGSMPEVTEAIEAVAEESRAVDDISALQASLSDPHVACLQAISWYPRLIGAGLQRACADVRDREMRMYSSRLLFVACKWDCGGLGDFLIDGDAAALEERGARGGETSDPLSEGTCLLFGAAEAVRSKDGAGRAPARKVKMLSFPALVKRVGEMMAPFLIEELPECVDDSQPGKAPKSSDGEQKKQVFARIISELIISRCKDEFLSASADFAARVSGLAGKEGLTGEEPHSVGLREKGSIGQFSAGGRGAKNGPTRSSAAPVILAMERLIVLSAQMQVILEYYKLDPSRAPSSTAIDALKDALAKCSRVLLAARIESASARTARKADGVGVAPGQPVPPQPAPHAPPAAFPDFPPSVFPDRGQLLSAADQLLMWRELKYLGVFPAEAERLFVRSAADLADRVSDGVRSAVARAFEPLNARPGPETDSLQGRPPQITCQAVCLAARGIYEYFNRLVTGGRPSGREAPGPDASETSFLQNLGNSLCHSIAEEAISGLIRQGAVGEKAARAATRELLGPAIDFISAHSSACLSGFSPEVASFMRQCRYSRSYRLTLENLGLASFVPVLCFCRVSAANEIYGAPTFQAAFTSCSQFQPHTVFPGLCIVDVLSPGEVSGLVKNRFELAAARERRDLAPFYEKVSVLKSLSSLDREEEEALQAGPAESTEPGR